MTQPRAVWKGLRPNATPKEIVQALNRFAPQVQPAAEAVATTAAAGVVRYVRTAAEITAADETTVTVTVTGRAPGDPTAGICVPPEGDALTAIRTWLRALQGTAVVSGGAVDAERPNPAVWVLERPAEGAAVAWATFEATLEGAQSDRAQLAIPPQGVEIVVGVGPKLTAVATASTDTTVTVDVTLSWSGAGAPATGTISVLSHFGLDPAPFATAPWTGPLPLVRAVVIPRPLFQAGAGRALFEGDAGGALARDSVDVPERQRDTATLAPELTQVGQTATTVSYIGTCPDPLGLGVTLVLERVGVALLSGTGVVGDPWVLQRPAFAAGTGRVTLVASGPTYVTGTHPADIPAVERDTVKLALRVVLVDKPTASTARYATLASDPTDAGAPVESRVETESGVGAPTTYDNANGYFTVTRPPFGSNAGRVVFIAQRTDAVARTPDRQPVDVPAVERDTITLAPELVRAGGSATTELYYAAHEPVPAGVGSILMTPSGTATVLSGSGTVGDPWVVARPAFGNGGTRLTVTASATGASSGTNDADVQPQEDTSVSGVIRSVHAFGFIPQIDTMRWQLANDGTYVWNPDTVNGSTLFYPIPDVPIGSIINDVSLSFRATAALDVQFDLYDGATAITGYVGADTGGADATVVATPNYVVTNGRLFAKVTLKANLGGTARYLGVVLSLTIPSLTTR